MGAVETGEVVVEITRTFAVPREQVFRAWTEAPRLMRWFAPKGFEVVSCDAEPGAGGAFRVCLRSSRGLDYWVRGTYREIEAPSRLVLACIAEDQAGQPRLEELIEVTLEAQSGTTTLRLRAAARGLNPEADAMLRAMPEVWAQTIDGLNTHLLRRS
jgi:uncharacterized protein YndB with AHSA1/START domain